MSIGIGIIDIDIDIDIDIGFGFGFGFAIGTGDGFELAWLWDSRLQFALCWYGTRHPGFVTAIGIMNSSWYTCSWGVHDVFTIVFALACWLWKAFR